MDILILMTYIIDINYWITGIIWHLKSAQVWIFAGSDFSCKFWNEICLKSGDIWIIWHIFESGQISTVYTHTRLTALFLGLPGWAGTRKVKTNLNFTETRDSEWKWHQLGHMQVCISLQTDNRASTPPVSFFTGRMSFLPLNHYRQSTEDRFCCLQSSIIARSI